MIVEANKLSLSYPIYQFDKSLRNFGSGIQNQ